MHNRLIQPIRIAVQLGFFFLTIYLGISFYRFVLYFRSGGLTPSVPRPAGVEAFLPISGLLGIKDWLVNGNINPIHPAAVVILLTAIVVSLLLKRSFCSWICPIGTISEILWKLGFSLFKRNLRPGRILDILLRVPKYLLLAFFLYFIMVSMPALAVRDFILSDYHKIADVRLLDFFLHLSGVALGFIVVAVVASIPLRNAFCRFLCPYGALLGLTSTISPVKVTRDSVKCVSCGVCTQVCPASIPVMAKERVSSPECFGCWRCISHCRAEGALAMKLPGRRIAINGILFAVLVVLFFWGGSILGKLTGKWETSVTRDEYIRLIAK